jgi:vacuolar-type H+-ATPase subunit H
MPHDRATTRRAIPAEAPEKTLPDHVLDLLVHHCAGSALCDPLGLMADVSRPFAAGLGPVGPVGPIGSFLERFRRSAGVPAAAGGDVSVELAPVFLALDQIEHEAAALRVRSEAAAAERLHKAQEEADRIVAEGCERADSERDDALKTGLRAADAEAVSILRRAEADAAEIRRSGQRRLGRFVDEVLARVFEAAP